MKTIQDNGGIQFYEKMDMLANQSHDSWRCIYINFSKQAERYTHTLYTHFVFRPLTELLSGMDGYIYRCEDQDIFILFQGSPKKIIAALGNHFGDMTTNLLEMRFTNGLFRLFDLSKDWDSLYAMSETKYLTAIAEQEAFRAHFSLPNPAFQPKEQALHAKA